MLFMDDPETRGILHHAQSHLPMTNGDISITFLAWYARHTLKSSIYVVQSTTLQHELPQNILADKFIATYWQPVDSNL